MAVFTRKGVFLHIPKTGGTWVKAAIEKAGLAVDHADDYHADLSKIRNDVRSQGKILFAFVRHPVEWVRSYWAFRKETRRFNDAFDPMVWAEEFDVFSRRVVAFEPRGMINVHFDRYIGPPGDRILVGLQENLVEDLILILGLIGEDFDPEVIRSTPRQRDSAAYLKQRSTVPPNLRNLIVASNRRLVDEFYQGRSDSTFHP